MKLYLYKAGVWIGTINEAVVIPIGTGGVGSYSWYITPGLVTGNDFQINIEVVGNIDIEDTSDGYFALTPATTPSAPLATFTVSGGIYQRIPATIQFTDTSTGTPTSWLWTFGDGTTDTLQNPTHTYTTPSWYDVSLTVANSLGSNTKTWVDAVCIIPALSPIPSFTVTP